MLTILSCAYLPSLHPLWWSVQILSQFLVIVFIFWLLRFKIFFWIRIYLLLDIWFPYLFYQSVAYLFTILTVVWQSKSFLTWRNPIYQFFLLWIVLLEPFLRNLYPTEVIKDFLLCIITKVLHLHVLCSDLWSILNSSLYKMWGLDQSSFSLYMGDQLVNPISWKPVLSPSNCFCICQRLNGYISVDWFLSSVLLHWFRNLSYQSCTVLIIVAL